MGKRPVQRAKGHGSMTYQVRKKAYVFKIGYPRLDATGKAKITKLFNSLAHSAPLAKIQVGNEMFYSPAADGTYEGQEIEINGSVVNGNIVKLKDIPQGTKIFNIEISPGKGGKIIRSSGCSAVIGIKDKEGVEVIIRRRRLKLNEECRATIGAVAGEGRKSKPLVKAGNKYFIMKARGRKWPRTSAIKTNAVDHPFGSGRGKRIKSKIAIRNASPGKKAGHIRPRRTGHIK
jgi:large subunit ribosomal protein L2